jgi:hydroxyethylthiazole kinase-like uncharacterized protein yjeF
VRPFLAGLHSWRQAQGHAEESRPIPECTARQLTGRSLAELAITRFSTNSVTVLAGPGGNGGAGLVAARHLANRGCQVQAVVSEPDRLTPVPAHQADILARLGVTIASLPSTADLILDALIGYSLRGNPIGTAAELITWTNDQAAPVLSLDTPSDLDLTTGVAGTPAVRATSSTARGSAAAVPAGPHRGIRGMLMPSIVSPR